MTLLRWLVDANIPDNCLGQGRDAMRSRVLVTVIFGLILIELLVYLTLESILAFGAEGKVLAYNMISFILTSSLAALLTFRLVQKRTLTANLFALCFWFALCYIIWHTGGIQSAALPLPLLLPVFMGITAGSRWGSYWTLFIVGTWIAFYAAGQGGFEFPQISVPDNYLLGQVICLSITCLLVSVAVIQYDATTSRLWDELHKERTDLELLSRHDQLTGLPNRRHFSQELDQAIRRASRNKGDFALVFFDLNSFKRVNDDHGHAVGDDLLKAIADRLVRRFRATDFVARWGGDEFAMIVESIATRSDLRQVIADLSELISQPVNLAGTSFSVEPSIGVAIYPRDGEDSTELLHVADKSMYRAKQVFRSATPALSEVH